MGIVDLKRKKNKKLSQMTAPLMRKIAPLQTAQVRQVMKALQTLKKLRLLPHKKPRQQI